MSKKHNLPGSSPLPTASVSHSEEYSAIRRDLLRVAVLNLVYLAAVLALYYSNVNSHFLERWFEKVIRI